ncbi:MAG: RluA family pseudouridine synthase [Clostridia bacterium]|nr:RluA family pseudouridine synthase [Clostridia bacterium]
MEILCNTKDIIVAIKPAGIPSENNGKDNMITRLSEYCETGEIYPVHRLDTVTSGVMVYAKTKKAAADITREIKDGTFRKTYLAVVHGNVEPGKGMMEDLLFKDSRKNKSFVVKRERKGVKKAALTYEVLEQKNGLSLVKIQLLTGRTHQIRVQFSSRRHPVYGDGKYGASDNIPFIALFSHSLTFKDPTSKKELTFTAPLPEWDFFR